MAMTLMCLYSFVPAQILRPVKWSYAFKKTGVTEGVIYLKADINSGWHIYSVNQPVGGPIKTSFEFIKSDKYSLIGRPVEPSPEKHFEKVFGINVLYFEHSVIFQQQVKLKSGLSEIKGRLIYMVCTDHQCLQPEELSFKIQIK